jgi:putative Holliday junction resolvase
MKRILGVDYGERRVGLAVSDELLITAQGLDTFDRKTGELVGYLASLVERYDVGEVVLGHPVSMSGRDNVTSRTVEALAGTLRDHLGIQVTLWDERLSSEEARRVLRGEEAGKGAVDRVAAILILQNFLDSRPRPPADSARDFE